MIFVRGLNPGCPAEEAVGRAFLWRCRTCLRETVFAETGYGWRRVCVCVFEWAINRREALHPVRGSITTRNKAEQTQLSGRYLIARLYDVCGTCSCLYRRPLRTVMEDAVHRAPLDTTTTQNAHTSTFGVAAPHWLPAVLIPEPTPGSKWLCNPQYLGASCPRRDAPAPMLVMFA
jgi:hypothetical protein